MLCQPYCSPWLFMVFIFLKTVAWGGGGEFLGHESKNNNGDILKRDCKGDWLGVVFFGGNSLYKNFFTSLNSRNHYFLLCRSYYYFFLKLPNPRSSQKNDGPSLICSLMKQNLLMTNTFNQEKMIIVSCFNLYKFLVVCRQRRRQPDHKYQAPLGILCQRHYPLWRRKVLRRWRSCQLTTTGIFTQFLSTDRDLGLEKNMF